MGSYTRLESDFAESPVVSIAGSRNQWLGAVGLGYTF
jgi:outer membrane scaffolding protein for murein synthesis (MipA/OmpV family)